MGTCCGRRLRLWMAWLLLLGAGSRGFGQEIAFLTNYTQARTQAAVQNRPLLLFVAGTACVECLRMENSTLRERSIVEMVGTNFLAVKLDADRDAKLVQAMQITRLPVTVLAAPDGTVLDSVVGSLDTAQMTGHMQLALSRLQQYRGGIRPGAEVPTAAAASSAPQSPGMAKGAQFSRSNYGAATTAPASPGYVSPSPYGGAVPGTPWTPSSNSYLSSFPDFFLTPRRC